MGCVRSMEEALGHRPTWAVIVVKSKVRLCVSSGEQRGAVIIDARVFTGLREYGLLLRASSRFHMTTPGNS